MIRMILLSGLTAFAAAADPVSGQQFVSDTPVRQALYVEVGGAASVASINYDRRFGDHWAARIGLEPDGSGPHISEWYPEIPVTASYLALSGRHRVEAGGGVVLSAGSRHWMDATVHLGYRYQPTVSGLLFRATLVRRGSVRQQLPGLPVWGGISLGYAF